MSLFIQPKAGLHLGEDYLSLAVLTPKSRGYQLKAHAIVHLPENTLRHSPSEPNILNLPELKKNLETLLSGKNIKNLSLSVPDLSTRMVLVEVKNALPAEAELNQMIKWNMEQKFLTEIEGAHFSHQIIGQSNKSFKNPGTENGNNTKHFFILGAAVLRSVLNEYESLLIPFQAAPLVIRNCSFHLFNFYHDFIFNTARPGNFLFLNFIDRYFTLMVFENKILRHLRTMPTWPGKLEDSGEEKEEIEKKNLLKALNEIESSLHYNFKDASSNSELHLFIGGTRVTPDFGAELSEKFNIKVVELNPFNPYGLEGLSEVRKEDLLLLSPAIAAAAGAFP